MSIWEKIDLSPVMQALGGAVASIGKNTTGALLIVSIAVIFSQMYCNNQISSSKEKEIARLNDTIQNRELREKEYYRTIYLQSIQIQKLEAKKETDSLELRYKTEGQVNTILNN